jgi:membrane-bound lytic murein transglycosylase MltF
MVERAYGDLEASGYSRTTIRTLDLVLAKAFAEQLGIKLVPVLRDEDTRTLLDALW